MIEFPSHIFDTFPVPSCEDVPFPERPWWRVEPRCTSWGIQGYVRANPWGDTTEVTVDVDREDALTMLAKRDATVPHSHPGFFPGQLWVFVYQQVTVGPYRLHLPMTPNAVKVLLQSSMRKHGGRDYDVAGLDGVGLSRADVRFLFFRDRGSILSRNAHAQCPDAHLLFDPRYPDRAPWSPAESTRTPEKGWLC